MGVPVSKANRYYYEGHIKDESDIIRTIRQIIDVLATFDFDNPDEQMTEITKLEILATQLETKLLNLDDKSTLRTVCKTIPDSLSSALTAKMRSYRGYKARLEDQKKQYEMMSKTCSLERDKQELQKEADKGFLEKGLGFVGNYVDSTVRSYFKK